MSTSKTAAELIDDLMQIHPKGFDLSLDRVLGLLDKLGNPQDRLPPVIHFAGTNGKGSTIAFTRAILEAHGLAVHVHTSPHLVNWHERYRIGQKGRAGALVTDDVLADAIDRVAKANDGQAITVFEVLTVVTFILFSENPADVCLIEVGLGGRFDATNVMKKTTVSVITPVSIDHEAYLGDTLAKIAFEKAGIIKQKVPVIVGPQDDEARDVIENQSKKMRAPVAHAGQDFSAYEEHGRMVFQDKTGLMDLALPALPGSHQISNAATAIAASKQLGHEIGVELDDKKTEVGLQTVSWPGRMQRLDSGHLFDFVHEGSEIWIDGGHNPGAAAMIAPFMKKLKSGDDKPLILICGMLNTKDPSGYFQAFEGIFDQVITVPIITSDAGIPADDLARIAIDCGFSAQVSFALLDAILRCSADGPARILIAGSLYLAGDALAQNETPPV